MNVYRVEHVTSSPVYPQSNGFAERIVQTVENILQKWDENKKDLYLALLSYRATLLHHQLKSAAELLMNREFKTRLPLCQRALLNCTDHETVKTKFITRQKKQAHYYNQNCGPPKSHLELTNLSKCTITTHRQEPGVI